MKQRGTHRWAVDGISDGVARIEEDGERMITVPAYLLPAGAREGQVLEVTSAAGKDADTLVVTIAVDAEATADALARSKATMSSAMKQSKKRDPGGDVAL